MLTQYDLPLRRLESCSQVNGVNSSSFLVAIKLVTDEFGCPRTKVPVVPTGGDIPREDDGDAEGVGDIEGKDMEDKDILAGDSSGGSIFTDLFKFGDDEVKERGEELERRVVSVELLLLALAFDFELMVVKEIWLILLVFDKSVALLGEEHATRAAMGLDDVKSRPPSSCKTSVNRISFKIP